MDEDYATADNVTRSRGRRHDVPLLYKYATPDAARAILVGRTLRWSSPQLFNDPFDVRRDLELPFTNQDLLEAMLDRYRAYLRGKGEPGNEIARTLLAGFRLARKRAPVETLMADLRETMSLFMTAPLELARKQFRDIWTERVPGMRILCFSTDATSPSMWAHYAANLAGVVFGFESSDERDSPWLLAQPVRYLNRRPSLPGADEWARALLGENQIGWERYLSEYYFVKSTHWSYENEYRVPSDRRKLESGLFSDYAFFEEDLREVILGPRADRDLELDTRDAVSLWYPNARVRRAQLDDLSRLVVADDVAEGAT